MGSLTAEEDGRFGPLEWGIALRAMPGQHRSGDAYVALSRADQAIMAVIDGLGHGPEAADAADTAVQTIRDRAGEPVETLIEHCHRALSDSRGAAMTVLQVGLADGVMTWLGVGNVDALILRRDVLGTAVADSALPAGGVVGSQMPPLRPRTVQLRGGDVLVMVTDGVTASWSQAVKPGQPAATTAQRILAEHARPDDDALVLTARYRGFP